MTIEEIRQAMRLSTDVTVWGDQRGVITHLFVNAIGGGWSAEVTTPYGYACTADIEEITTD